MVIDISGRGLYSIKEYLSSDDFPLAELINPDDLPGLFDSLYVTRIDAFPWNDNVVLEMELAIQAEIALTLPGCDAFAIVLMSGGADWMVLDAEIILGPDFSITLRDASIGLRFPPSLLRDVNSSAGGEILLSGDIFFSPVDGIRLANFAGASLSRSYLCGTQIIVEASGVLPIFGPQDLPLFVTDPNFQGIAIERLKLSLPSDVLQLDPGSMLDITLSNASIGSTGFSGSIALTSGDLGGPVSGKLLGFPFRFRGFALDIQHNGIVDIAFGADIRLTAFEEAGHEKWVGVDVQFGPGDHMAVGLSATQPSEASSTSAALVEIKQPGAFALHVTALRVVKDEQLWAFYFSGDFQMLISGAVTWPKIAIDELGLRSDGKLLLPDGDGIQFASPMIVNWHFVRLTVSKFKFGYADTQRQRMAITLSAEVLIIDGVPSGASIEGLVVEWTPGSNAAPAVRMQGIGIAIGVPGTFQGSLKMGYIEVPGSIEFRGQGALALPSLDMSLNIGVIVGYQSNPAPPFPFMYLFADAKLMPSGIPIAQTGVSIYGFQGLIAYNMALDIDPALPDDERYYQLFVRNPIGITDSSKWVKHFGQNALGIGVLLGTADSGFALNVKGLFVVAFPDVTLMLQAKANFLKVKPDLSTAQEGTLDALLVYASGQGTLSLDIVMKWGIPVIISVEGHARAFFAFNDPRAWYLEAGRDEDGKRISAHIIEWDGGWLFTAGFWFRLDADGVVTGAQIELKLREESGGFWVEVYGFARGEAALSWNPSQLEGSYEQRGRISAGFHGISIGIELGGAARGRIKNPYDVQLHVEACVQFFGKICKSFDWKWQHFDPPPLRPPVQRWIAKPRHWTPRPLPNNPNERDLGIVVLDPTGAVEPVIQPHSVIGLEFAKPMVDIGGMFNEAVALDDAGFMTIGRDSGWSAAYQLDAVRMTRIDGNTRTAVALWGTWGREGLLPNTLLRLGSSERFAHDGSLTSAFGEGRTLDYCDPPKTTRNCVDLSGLEPGYGYLPDGSLYHYDPAQPGLGGGGQPGTLEPGGSVEVVPVGPTPDSTVTVTTEPGSPHGNQLPPWLAALCKRGSCFWLRIALVLELLALLAGMWMLRSGQLRPTIGVLLLCVFIALLLLFLLGVCSCRRKPASTASPDIGTQAAVGGRALSSGGAGPSRDPAPAESPDAQSSDVSVTVTPGLVVFHNDGSTTAKLDRWCYDRGQGSPAWTTLTERGGTITQNEIWTVPAEMKLLPPNSHFEIEASYTAKLRAPDGSIQTPLGVATSVVARFRTSGPPAYTDALREYVASVYPFDGARPVYLGYDLQIRFHEDYVPYLYTSLGDPLVFRLFDAQGQPVRDASGQPAVVPATTVGPTTQSTTQALWEEIYQVETERGCISGPPVRHDSYNTLSAPVDGWVMSPNSAYTAWLVRSGNPAQPLYAWSFVTSRYASFTELVSVDREVRAQTVPAGAVLTSGDFDGLARAAGVPTVAYALHPGVTVLCDAARSAILGLLIEAPEPLEAPVRLSVDVDGAAARSVPNLDSSRVFAMPSIVAWPSAISVKLVWKRDAGTDAPLLAVRGDTRAEELVLSIDLQGLPL